MLLFDSRLNIRRNVAVVAIDILLRGDAILFSLVIAIDIGYDILLDYDTRYIKILSS